MWPDRLTEDGLDALIQILTSSEDRDTHRHLRRTFLADVSFRARLRPKCNRTSRLGDGGTSKQSCELIGRSPSSSFGPHVGSDASSRHCHEHTGISPLPNIFGWRRQRLPDDDNSKKRLNDLLDSDSEAGVLKAWAERETVESE